MNHPEITENLLVDVYIANTGEADMTLIVEPWAEEHILPVGKKFNVQFFGEPPANPEIEFSEKAVVVWSPRNAKYMLIFDGEKEISY